MCHLSYQADIGMEVNMKYVFLALFSIKPSFYIVNHYYYILLLFLLPIIVPLLVIIPITPIDYAYEQQMLYFT